MWLLEILYKILYYTCTYQTHHYIYFLKTGCKNTLHLTICYCSFLYFILTGEGGPPDTTFIEDAVLELLKTRRILKCSYPYGFFLEPKSTKKEIYELMQVSMLDWWKILTVCRKLCNAVLWVSARNVLLILYSVLDWFGDGNRGPCTESKPPLSKNPSS